MKKTVCIVIALSLLVCLTACGPEPVDVFSEALTLTDFGESLEDMPLLALGGCTFYDYSLVHANPTKIADLPLGITAESKKINGDAGGLGDFIRNSAKSFGYRNEYTLDYEKAANLDAALEMLFAASGSSDGLEAAKAAAANVSDKLKPALAEFLSAAAKACEYFLDCASEISDKEYKALQDYVQCYPATNYTSPLKNVYEVSRKVGERNYLAAGMLVTDASATLAKSVKKISSLTKDGKALTIETPAGLIILGSSEDDVYNSPEALLLIDKTGNDVYNGRVAASISKEKPVSVVIDLAGDDLYDSKKEKLPSQGAGILGAGLLFDMAGNDTYKAVRASQGFALAGIGVLFDASGNDSYNAEISSQSFGHFGISALVDVEGNDNYYSFGFSQASAGSRAMCFLVDKKGNDDYSVAVDVQPGYEDMQYGDNKVNGNWSQGCAAGNRSVSTDLGTLSGGIAGMIDLDGDDSYSGGFWVQGTGYWSGYGFLTNINGDDVYNSRYYSHSSVAHYAVAALIDIGGNDRHLVVPDEKGSVGEGASMAFTFDKGVTLLVDDGGDDVYDTKNYSIGSSRATYDDKGFKKQDMTYAFFIDTAGKDTYPMLDNFSFGWGRGGFFFDLRGEDTYKDIYMSNDITDVKTAGVFMDCDKNGYVPFWTEARKKFGI